MRGTVPIRGIFTDADTFIQQSLPDNSNTGAKIVDIAADADGIVGEQGGTGSDEDEAPPPAAAAAPVSFGTTTCSYPPASDSEACAADGENAVEPFRCVCFAVTFYF